MPPQKLPTYNLRASNICVTAHVFNPYDDIGVEIAVRGRSDDDNDDDDDDIQD